MDALVVGLVYSAHATLDWFPSTQMRSSSRQGRTRHNPDSFPRESEKCAQKKWNGIAPSTLLYKHNWLFWHFVGQSSGTNLSGSDTRINLWTNELLLFNIMLWPHTVNRSDWFHVFPRIQIPPIERANNLIRQMAYSTSERKAERAENCIRHSVHCGRCVCRRDMDEQKFDRRIVC